MLTWLRITRANTKQDAGTFRRAAYAVAAACAAMVFVLAACQGEGTEALESADTAVKESSPRLTITLGDIDANEPAKKIKRFQPLANYLAEHLEDFGIKGGNVVIARDIEEMAKFLKDGTVDVYFDSPYPTLATQERSGSQVILRRWKKGVATYWSTYITLGRSGIESVDDLLGKVVAVEEPYSTSGFVLPVGTLAQRGFSLKQVNQTDARLGSNEIGYYFTWDDKNTVELVLRGEVAGGVIDNVYYDELALDYGDQIVAIDRTVAVPRQLVSVRAGLKPTLLSRVRELLIDLERTEEGRELLDGLKKTAKFDELPAESVVGLGELQEMMSLVASE